MITMQGHTRLFGVPDRLQDAAGAGAMTAWEMTRLGPDVAPALAAWAGRVVHSVTASAAAPAAAALDCLDCDDTGWYGQADPADPDRLTGLYRRHGDGLRVLRADGRWVEPVGVTVGPALEVLTDEIAQDLADAVLAGAHLVRRYLMPAAFLPPSTMLVPDAHPAILAAVTAPAAPAAVEQSPTDDGNVWLSYAVVDPLDTGAVLQVVRLRPGPTMERYDGGGVWVPDPPVLASLTGLSPPPLVELDPTVLADVLGQVDSGAAAEPETTTAAGGSAETLRRYWSTGGKGGAKIRWGTPGDWTRCYKYLQEYLGPRAKGYCQNMHKRNTGTYAGAKATAASGAPTMMKSPEQLLLAALVAGAWVGTSTTMTTDTLLRDGIYESASGLTAPVVKALIAGGFPDVPPAEWFENPRLTELTPTVVEESGRVYGHMADWNMPHIGLPGQVRPPRSRSGYRYFNRNSLHAMAAGGGRTTVTVGQLTLVGGHAPMSADAGQAVAHYDNTESAVVDVHVGEDAHGIWFAGALRSSVTPDRLRAFTASSLSGDWRPINGGLELVACCCVNVPGFPIARARVAGGAVQAFTGFGAEGVAMVAAARSGNFALAHRLSAVEADLMALRASAAPDTEVVVTVGDADVTDLVQQSMRVVEEPAPGGVVPADAGVEVTLTEGETVEPLVEDEAAVELLQQSMREEPAAVRRARERGLMARARVAARVHRTTPEVEYARLVAAAAPVQAGGFKLEDWMTPMGADGQVVKTGARIAVSSASDESVAVAKVVDVTRGGIKVKWVAGRSGTSTIKLADVATLVRTSAAPQEQGSPDTAGEGTSDPKAAAPSNGATAVAAAAVRPVPVAVARARRAALLAAFNPNQLRDNRGRFIEMGASVNVKGDDGKERRGTVTKLTKLGPQVTYDDNDDGGPKVEIVPSDETTDRIQVAPEAKAELPGGVPPQALTDGKVTRVDDGKPSMGDADTKVTNISDYSDREVQDLRDATDDPEERQLLQDELDSREQSRSGVSYTDEDPADRAQAGRDTKARMDAAAAAERKRRKPQTAAQQRADVAADTADQYAPGKSVGRMKDATGKTVEMMPSKADKIAPGTPLDNANLIMRVRLMHGAGSAKHLAAVRDYGGPKPKKKSSTPRNGIGMPG